MTGPPLRADSRASTFSDEIQALRALAVVLVVIFHLWPLRLSGGFVGVDVFFAISGYLITGHLLREAGSDPGISLHAFWARRVRRLLPAACVVLVASLLATVLFLPLRLWEETAKEIGASALGIQNWVLAANSVDYFGVDNTPTLVQHFWSLSLEEQFYVVWPVLLFCVFILMRRRTALGRTRAVATVMVIVFVLSIAWSIVDSTRDQSAAYFSTFTHAWELAGGGLLALMMPRLARSRWVRMHRLRALTTVAGILAILVSAVMFTGHSAFPGWIALLPVLGALVVIAAGHSESRIQRALLLGSRPVQLLGGTSYSIYLWHWPQIVVLPFTLGAPLTTLQKVLILAASIALGWVSKRFVEDPARRSRPLNHRLWLTYAVAIVAIGAVTVGSASVVSAAVAHRTLAQRVAKDATSQAIGRGESCFGAAAMASPERCPDSHLVAAAFGPDFASSDWGSLAGVTKDGNLPPNVPCTDFSTHSSRFMDCRIGADPKVRTVAIVGDSHGLALLEPLVRIAQGQGWNVRVVLHNSCTPSEPMPFTDPDARVECNNWRLLVDARIANDHTIDTVIATGYTRSDPLPDYGGTKATLEAGYAKLWSTWARSGKRVYVIYDVPATSGRSVPDCVAATSAKHDPCTVARAAGLSYDPLPGSVHVASSPRVTGIDLSDQFCDAKRCHAVIGGVIAYRDFHHLSGTFALTLISALDRGLGLPVG